MASLNQTLSPMQIYALQAPANICWIIFGFLSTIPNFIIIFTVAKTKNFRTKSQLLVAGMAAADVALGLTYLGTGLKRYLVFATGIPDITSAFACNLRSMPLNLFAIISSTFKTALSIDRLLAMSCPVFYHTLSISKYFLTITAWIGIYALVHMVLAFVGYKATLTLSVCTALAVQSQWFTTFSGIIGKVQVAITVAMYAVSLILLRRRLLAIKQMNEQQMKAERGRMELGTFRTIVVVVVGYLLVSGSGYFTYMILPLVTGDAAIILAPFFGLIFIFDCSLHLFIFILMSKTFRKAVLAAFSASNDKVYSLKK